MSISKRSHIPSFLLSSLSGSRVIQLTFGDVQDTNIQSTSSFLYDAPRTGLKSSQQLNVDWSQFQNHTFFMSAEAKVNLAFDQIINGYPFDGTRAEIERFFEKLTGFDAWVFQQFPKFKGQLRFSGTQVGEDTDGTSGNWIKVKDHVGAMFPEIAKRATGKSILTPNEGVSMTVEMQLKIPQEATLGHQVVFQKMSGPTLGFSMYLEPTGSSELVNATFSVVSGSKNMSTHATLEKGTFEHLAVTLNRENNNHFLQFFKNGEIVDTSRNKYVIGDLAIESSDFLIATGSQVDIGSTTVVPTQTLSGTLDEFRLFHSARTTRQLQEHSRKAIYSTDDLKLYFRFNEPPPPLVSDEASPINGIVLDSSGNSLHSVVNGFTGSLREDVTEDPTSRMEYEKAETSPVLFTANSDVVALNVELMQSASVYDKANPNLITRLVPRHYLEEGQANEGYPTIEGSSDALYENEGIPGQGQKNSAQIFLTFLYVYARFFDEIKIFVDSFRNLRHVDYETNDTIPNNFLLDIVEEFGFNLPPLFNDSSIEQYIRAENIDRETSTSEFSLRHVQNELLRRVLVNLPGILRSKGTQHSIKSFLRALGIDPENSLRIREFGGPTKRSLSYSRETKREPNFMVEFTSSSLAVSPMLVSPRVEFGFPTPAGSLVPTEGSVHGVSDDPNDSLLTSGSWTVEQIVKWTPDSVATMSSLSQSLGRLCVIGSIDSEGGVLSNLVAISGSTPKLTLYVRSGKSLLAPMAAIELPVDGLFNGERWNVSFGCTRNDELGSRVSSSYFIRAASQSEGNIESIAMTSSYFDELYSSSDLNVFRELDVKYNHSGSYFAIGNGQEIISGSSGGGTYAFLNDTLRVNDEARTTAFDGLVSNLRFWSKTLTEQEWKEHVRNYKSRGVADPLTNWNYVTTKTGSFGRLRMETFTKQQDRQTTTGEFTFIDFSENNNHMTGTNFPVDTDILRGEVFDYSYLSPVFDEASTNEKVRSRGFLNQSLVDSTPWAATSPVYEIPKSEEPTDDVRFSIEFSLIDALNRDIVTIFSSLDAMENAIGNPELLFSPDYPDLDRMRDVYFNRIKDKLNFKAFFEFFRWFDGTMGTFIEQLIPRKTNFKGTNFVVESHMLERHKLEYFGNEMYLGDSERDRINDAIFLQQFTGILRKW